MKLAANLHGLLAWALVLTAALKLCLDSPDAKHSIVSHGM